MKVIEFAESRQGISFAADMGRKNKLKRFAEVAALPNVFEIVPEQPGAVINETGGPVLNQGQWNSLHFDRNVPLVLELACGKGEYTLALARDNPDQNFIGVDIKGARIWKGANQAIAEGLKNAVFLRTRIEFIDRFFAPGEVSEIWITFPDPFEGKPRRRLTSIPFLDRYKKFLKPNGIIHLKTDSPILYEFTLETLAEYPGAVIHYANDDIYHNLPLFNPALEHKTYYEVQHLANGRTIKYIKFSI